MQAKLLFASILATLYGRSISLFSLARFIANTLYQVNAAPATAPGGNLVGPPPACTVSTILVGNGNPHQNGLHKQVSEPIQCSSDAGCSVSHLTSYTIGYSASATIAQWIGGGFSVSESFTTGNTYTCNGNPGDTVCVWVNLAHTAYTVQNFNSGECTPDPGPGTPFVLKSPNKNNAGGDYYCVIGSGCGTNGQSYWDNSGP